MNQISQDAALPVLRREEVLPLAGNVRGSVLVPGDPGYADECRIYNEALSLEPAVVVGAASAVDVSAAVRFAADRGRPVAVKTTGHQIVLPGRGAVLITTHRMKEISVDARRRTARVQAGVIWQEVIDAAWAHGLAPVSGSAPDVGVTGYTLGGGLSPFLGRSHGWAADHVLSLDVVTAEGRLRMVTADDDPELFWAMRGCKGNFGVVTSLEFTLFPVSQLYGGALYYSGEHLADVLHAWRSWVVELPEQANASVAVQRLPPLPELPEPLRGANVVHLRFSHLGPAEEGERLLAPLRAVAPAVLDTVADMPYTAVRRIHSDPVGPIPYWDRTTTLRDFPAEAADAFVEVLGPDSDSPLVNVEIRYLAGALGRDPVVPNAVSTRGVRFAVFGFGVGGPDQANLMRRSLAAVVDALEPWTDKHALVNFLSAEEATTPDQMADVFGRERFARLTAVKKAYDPSNTFRINHNVPARRSTSAEMLMALAE